MPNAKTLLVTSIGVLGAAVAVEAFYQHPTYGRGLRALAAVAGLL